VSWALKKRYKPKEYIIYSKNKQQQKKPRKFPKSQERFILSGIEVPEASRTPNRHDQNKTSPQHVIKTTNTEKEKEY
jgi:hypothetical protein